ncbi:hypothetical protein OH768_47040 [Streptomyces sp. NBC_01622]|uniref:hypothetical protein n=1 Tax=Streptomyces sp. NBC_01622 TaxID=2975903 RepID=UPI003862DBE5|nr:hypothetical protein OH768_47040 [Streptomyces sp. NBC_01622]
MSREVPAISTFDELHELGHIGPVCLSLIYKLIREEARRLPVLSPPSGWQEADLENLLGDFLADRIEPVTAKLLALARDDDSVGKLLRTSIRYWLIDCSRKTAVVSVGRALEKVLTDSDALEAVPLGTAGAGRWRLAGTAAQPWSGPVTPLVEAAYAVPNVKIPRWSSETRRAPVADRASIEAVIIAVLTAASGSMEVAQLVEVFTARFPAVLDPVVVSLPADAGSEITENAQSSPEKIVFARIDDAETASRAEEVVSMLSPEEQRMVPYLDAPGEIQTLLGCGRSQAYHRAARLREKLRQLVGDGDDVLSVGAEVIRFCSGVAETR